MFINAKGTIPGYKETILVLRLYTIPTYLYTIPNHYNNQVIFESNYIEMYS